MEGCGKFIKYIVFIVNLVIMMGGMTIMAVGIWTLVDKAYLEKLLESKMYQNSAVILLAMGGFITVISFIGCCGAIKEVKCLLLLFFFALLIIFVVMLVGAILGFVMKDQVKDYLTEGMNATMIKYGEPSFDPITKAWDSAQKELKCCGIRGYQNWTVNAKFKTGGVPQSCCKDQTSSCSENPTPETAYNEGCLDKVSNFIKEHAGPLAGIAIAIALILVLGMIFSCALYMMI